VATSGNPLEVKILPPHAAAEYVGLSESMLAKMRCLGGGPERVNENETSGVMI